MGPLSQELEAAQDCFLGTQSPHSPQLTPGSPAQLWAHVRAKTTGLPELGAQTRAQALLSLLDGHPRPGLLTLTKTAFHQSLPKLVKSRKLLELRD